MKKIKYIIYTHFNVNFNWSPHCQSFSRVNKKWMDHRIDLFHNFCYPSVLSQTDQDFEWVIFFNKDKTNTKWVNSLNKVTPVYLESVNPKDFQSDAIKRSKGFDWLITTRLDNDDIISKNFIETVKSQFDETEKLVNFNNGYIFDTIENKFFKHSRNFNAFSSLIENTKNIKTIFQTHHPLLSRRFPTYPGIDNEKRMWIQVVHSKNVANLQNGILCKNPNLEDFEYKKEILLNEKIETIDELFNRNKSENSNVVIEISKQCENLNRVVIIGDGSSINEVVSGVMKYHPKFINIYSRKSSEFIQKEIEYQRICLYNGIKMIHHRFEKIKDDYADVLIFWKLDENEIQNELKNIKFHGTIFSIK